VGAVYKKMLGFAADICGDGATKEDWLILLCDLKVSRTVGIKIGLAVKFAEVGHACIYSAAKLHGFSHSFLVENGQRAGLACAYLGDVRIGLIAEMVGRSAKELGFCIELDVNF
jgi:hypothetical protein